MKKKSNDPFRLIVGIDVSSTKADASIASVSLSSSGHLEWKRKKVKVQYTISDVNHFLETIRKYKSDQCAEVIIAMEVTGVYHENIYNYLVDHCLNDEKVILLEPKYVNRWCLLHQKSKSDPLDAQSITQIVANESDYVTVDPKKADNEKGYSDLKAATHRHFQLKKLRNQEQNRLLGHLAVFFPEAAEVLGKGATFLAIVSKYPSRYDIMLAPKEEVYELASQASKNRIKKEKIDRLFALCEDSLASAPTDCDRQVIRDLVETICLFDQQLQDLHKTIKQEAGKYPEFEILCSLPGCGLITAANILAEIGNMHRFSSADKLVSYVGIDPINKRSGSSVEVLGHISKKGSKYLRHAIFMVAEFARRHNPVLKTLFDRVKAGKKSRHKAAVVAVANKIVRYIFSILKNGTPFVIQYQDLQKLSEEARNSFLQNITQTIPKYNRRRIYRIEQQDGSILKFTYGKLSDEDLVFIE